MTLYTEDGVDRCKKIRKDLNPLVSGREWAKGRYHPNKAVKESVAVSKSKDNSVHQSIETNTLELHLYSDPVKIEEDL